MSGRSRIIALEKGFVSNRGTIRREQRGSINVNPTGYCVYPKCGVTIIRDS